MDRDAGHGGEEAQSRHGQSRQERTTWTESSLEDPSSSSRQHGDHEQHTITTASSISAGAVQATSTPVPQSRTAASSASTLPASSPSSLRSDSHHSAQDEKLSSRATPTSKWHFLDPVIRIISWKPKRVRWDPSNPPRFSLALNVLFGFAGAFTVGNLYYSHPILNVLARDFGVSNEKVAQIPTLAQAGYATGLLLLNPLGDVFRRRAFVLSLVWFTATVWIGLCVTSSFTAFSGLTYLTGVTTVTPQIMLPLVGDLAPPDRRAAALSIVNSGNLLGILIARILSGIVANYTSWRVVYWIAFALQYFILILLWNFMPDYPATNARLPYWEMLWSMLCMLKKHPVLVQACIIAFCSSAPFTSYWTTLTFLLSGPTYNYAPLPIGLWALIGIAGICITPFTARRIIDGFVPLFSIILGESIALIGVVVGTYSGLYSVVGPAFQAFFLDLGLGTTQVANRSSIYSCEPNARNRINTVFMLAVFTGQITGTSAGNKLYAMGGWIGSGSLSVGFLVFALLTIAARGPWEQGWLGWSGGWSIRKKEKMSANGLIVEKAMHTGVSEDDDAKNDDAQNGASSPSTAASSGAAPDRTAAEAGAAAASTGAAFVGLTSSEAEKKQKDDLTRDVEKAL